LQLRLFRHPAELGRLQAGDVCQAARRRGADDRDHEPGGVGLGPLGLPV